MGALDLMAAPFAECMVLVGIHTYLGIHVLRRRVIFVDLALAQIAALGTMVGFLFGILPETSAALIVSMAATFVGAAVFALTRVRGERIPQEAVIGLAYAITAAIAVLMLEKTQGGEHLKEILVGCILWVSWTDVATAAAVYSVIGVLHFVFRRQFFLISEDPEEARRQGLSLRAWDFFFYITFGFVIAISVRVAGVLLVFVFLVAPAIMAFLITDRLLHQLIIGWVMGTVVTMVGLFLSYVVDLPSGPTVIAFYGIALTLGALVFYVVRSKRRAAALGWIGAGIGGTCVVCLLFYLGATWLATTPLAVSEERRLAEVEVQRSAREAKAGLTTASAHVADIKGGMSVTPCQKHYQSLPDAEARLELITNLMKHCEKGGLKLLLTLLSDPETPVFFRSEGRDLLKKVTGQDFGYDPDQDPPDNPGALEKLRQHLHSVAPGKPVQPAKGVDQSIKDCMGDC